MSRLAWCLISIGLVLVPVDVRAQCVLEGDGVVGQVTPIGTTLHFGVDERARVVLDGVSAQVNGLAPIAFAGRARSRDVELSLAHARRVLGIVRAAAGTGLRVTRVRSDRVSARIDAGPTQLWAELPCSALAFGDPPTGEPVVSPETAGHGFVRVRGEVLRAHRNARSEDAVVLRLRAGSDQRWPDLEVLGALGGRVHVRAELQAGLVLDAWVASESVEALPALLSSVYGCGCMGAEGGCGHGFQGETYRGPARLASGAELTDDHGSVWGHVVAEVAAEVVVTTIRSTSSSSSGVIERHLSETVWVEHLPGIIPDSCSTPRIQVARASVTLPGAR